MRTLAVAVLATSIVSIPAIATAQGLSLSAEADSDGAEASAETSEPAPSSEPGDAAAAPSAEAAPAAPDQGLKKNGVYADLSLGVLGIAYERVLTDTLAVNIAAQYYRPWYVSDHVFGFGGELRAFAFLLGDASAGLYASPGFRLAYVKADLDDGIEEEGYAWSVRGTLGGSIVLFDVLSLRVGGGLQSHAADLVAGSDDPDFGGAYPAADLYVGGVF